MSAKTYDLIIIGGGSIGVPTALEFASQGGSVLVIEALPSPGQGDNKKAIGGIRATHSDRAKIEVCQRSLELFSTWEEIYGDDIDWRANGYSFPAWTKSGEKALKDLMKIQQSFGLNIRWVDPKEYLTLNPHINREGLRGSTYSPEDGSASPLLFIESAYFKAREKGVEFRFKERVSGLEVQGDKVVKVVTDKGAYSGGLVLNAAGAFAQEVARMVDLYVPVLPDSHEAAISEPIEKMVGPMVVDVRKRPGSANFYFYQAKGGQIIFCMTLEPPALGTDTRSTSSFLPQIAKRMVEVMPTFINLKVRRTWRGTYPMTPDGFPIVGRIEPYVNLFHAVGMCGQGFMLGPGLAETLVRLFKDQTIDRDRVILRHFDPLREFSGKEAFK